MTKTAKKPEVEVATPNLGHPIMSIPTPVGIDRLGELLAAAADTSRRGLVVAITGENVVVYEPEPPAPEPDPALQDAAGADEDSSDG